MTYYALLGLRSDSEGTTAKQRCQHLQTLLPTKTHSRLQKAARVLSNPVARQEYDRQLAENNGRHITNFTIYPR